MEIIVENGVDTAGLETLLHALKTCDVTAACCIGGIDKGSVYIRCPGAMHGIIFCRNDNNEPSIRWAIDALKNSLALSVSST